MKFNVTPELATLLRTLRMQNNISAKELASHLEKSPSYISKLESGTVKFIRKETLTEIFMFISGETDFYGAVLPGIVRVLRSFTAENRLASQTWLLQYDVAERRVTIPGDMAADLSEKARSLSTTADEIARFANDNIDSEMASAFPVNQIVSIDYQGSARLLFRTEISAVEVENILASRGHTTELIMLINVVYTLFRFAIYGKIRKKMPPEQAVQVLKSTDRYMEQYEVNSLVSFSRLLSSDEYVQTQLPLLSAFHTSSNELISDISSFFEEAFSKNELDTAKILKNLSDMLSWDPAFTMKLLGLPFADLEGLSYQNKRRLISDISELLNRYDSMSDFDKKWEEY